MKKKRYRIAIEDDGTLSPSMIDTIKESAEWLLTDSREIAGDDDIRKIIVDITFEMFEESDL